MKCDGSARMTHSRNLKPCSGTQGAADLAVMGPGDTICWKVYLRGILFSNRLVITHSMERTFSLEDGRLVGGMERICPVSDEDPGFGGCSVPAQLCDFTSSDRK